MPAKYREMHDFHEYYSGARTAPYLTMFVGGNHEASSYLFELYYGGWVAPNIYYMGAANVLRLGPLRIAGMSGIWKGFDYKKSHHERLPYNNDDVKSIYHVREVDVRKLLQIRTQVDVGISHDWPREIEWKGDHKRLFRIKAHLEDDAKSGRLGSVAAKDVLDRLRPRQWFSAHLHCKYAAVVHHAKTGDNAKTNGTPKEEPTAKNQDDLDMNDEAPTTDPAPAKNADEIDLDMDDQEPTADKTLPANADEIDLELEDDDDPTSTAQVAPGQGLDSAKVPVDMTVSEKQPSAVPEDLRSQLPASFLRPKPEPRAPVQPMSHPPDITNTETHFLALDKCLPNRDFLQLLTIPVSTRDEHLQRPLKLEYDPEFLAITRALTLEHPLVVGHHSHRPAHDLGESHYLPLIQEQEKWVEENLVSTGKMTVPDNFTITAPVFDASMGLNSPEGTKEYSSPQTTKFCELLALPNPFDISDEDRQSRMNLGPRPDEERFDGGGRGGRGGFSRGGGRGRGGRGGFGRGGGRGGRGRGRGRGGPY